MSFCQKHANHHCIHAHTCNKHQHQNKRQPSTRKIVVNPPQARPTTQGACLWEGSSSNKQCTVVGDQGKLEALKLQSRKLTARVVELEQKNRDLASENNHFKAQIEYYREQFTQMIERNTVDSREVIKKNLKLTTDLELRVASLTSENSRLTSENEQLKLVIHDTKALKQRRNQANYQSEQKYHTLYQNLKETDRQRLTLQALLDSKCKEETRIRQKYQILKKQFEFQQNKIKTQLMALEAELRTTKSELSKVHSQTTKQTAIQDLERTHSDQKIDILQKKLNQERLKNQKLTESLTQLTIKCQQLTDDLTHSQSVLEKHLQLRADVQSLADNLGSGETKNQNVLMQVNLNKRMKEQESQETENQKLREQIRILNQQIQTIETNNKAKIEEIVLQMGASEAFQKLLQEKNRVIKKLMKQKGQIYAKVCPQM